MNTSFSRVMTLLRKEKNVSQKKAAEALGVSQALLSHYEKGIRECGLDFVVRAADYYDVSCDYLLGRTADKKGSMIAAEEIPEDDPNQKDNQLRGSVLPVLNKKLVVNSVNIIYDILQRSGNKALVNEVSAYLMLALYTVYRQMYSARPENPLGLFSVEEYRYYSRVLSEMSRAAANIRQLASGQSADGEEGVDPERMPSVAPEELRRAYPLFTTSLLNLLHNAEVRMKS